MFIKKDDFLIKCNNIDKTFIESIKLGSMLNKMQEFFEIQLEFKVRIFLLYSLQEFAFFSYNKFETWKCGFFCNHIIYVFSPSIIEKLTIHSKKDVVNVISHELAHIFYNRKNFTHTKILEEGLATYLSFYDREKTRKLEVFEADLAYDDPKKFYSIGFSIVDCIIEKFGKQKLFEILKTTNNIEQLKKLGIIKT